MTRMPRLTPRKTPKQDRSRALVAAMLEAAKRVILREGFEATTVNEIARVAGVSPGSVYQYFPTKESIVTALHVWLFEGGVGYLAENLLEIREAPLEEVAEVLAAVVLRVHRDDADILAPLLVASMTLGSERKLAPIRAKAQKLLSGFLAARDDLRPTDVGLAGTVLISSLYAIVEEILRSEPGRLDDELLFDELRHWVLVYLRLS